MIRRLSTSWRSVAVTIPLRAVNKPHAVMDSQKTVVWTNNYCCSLSDLESYGCQSKIRPVRLAPCRSQLTDFMYAL
jgi:hypothetical protein